MDLDKKYKELQRTLLHYAAMAGQVKMLKVLLRRNASADIQAGDRGFTPLHNATRMGQERAVEVLLKHGADIEARSNEGYTALHHAARCGQSDIGKILVAGGAQVNAVSGLISINLWLEHITRTLHYLPFILSIFKPSQNHIGSLIANIRCISGEAEILAVMNAILTNA